MDRARVPLQFMKGRLLKGSEVFARRRRNISTVKVGHGILVDVGQLRRAVCLLYVPTNELYFLRTSSVNVLFRRVERTSVRSVLVFHLVSWSRNVMQRGLSTSLQDVSLRVSQRVLTSECRTSRGTRR